MTPFDRSKRRITNPATRVAGFMEAAETREIYHVVCRECGVEQLCGRQSDAISIKRDHVTETGHHVVAALVA